MPAAQRPSRWLSRPGAPPWRAVVGRAPPWVWAGGSARRRAYRESPKPQQAWLGLPWNSAREAPGKVSCRPFGAESLSEQELSLQSQRTAQETAPQVPEEMKGAAPGPLSWGRSHFCSLGWAFPCAKMGMPPSDLCRHVYRKHTGLFIHKIEERCGFCFFFFPLPWLGPGAALQVVWLIAVISGNALICRRGKAKVAWEQATNGA